MRAYVVDDLRPEHVERLKKAMEARGLAGSIADIYWFPLPADLLSEEQHAHSQGCGPYVLSLETLESGVSLELLVRARNRLRCSCVCYATPEQRDWGMDYLDNLFRELDIPV